MGNRGQKSPPANPLLQSRQKFIVGGDISKTNLKLLFPHWSSFPDPAVTGVESVESTSFREELVALPDVFTRNGQQQDIDEEGLW
ncbi:hypothetical protein RHMOL_Rhmol03G0106100 [Rhododendron molle]|uniref:Uncharacterized protein n=1 Tax=Rhododendron molle TaxID=49168 RepID=A0ACC0PCJ0_RHOML|nr:hypothetical protein RHMOL_Rhmol03G0106100 [Rhododendron molle]